MAAALLPLLIAFQTAPGVKLAEPLRINPDRPACVGARAFPVIKARIEPWNTVQGARLHFRPEGYPLWYSVAMQRTAEGFVALLPKPRPSARRVLFFIEAEGLSARARSLEQSALVVEEAAQCPGEVAPGMETAAITVAVPQGAPAVPPVPPGFEPVGAVGELGGGHGRRDSLVTAGVLAAAVGTALALKAGGPANDPPPPSINPELTVIDTDPPPESRLSLAQGAVMAMRVRVRLHQAIAAGQVTAVLFRAAEGVVRPCGVLSIPHDGFLLGVVHELRLAGPLQQARPCEPSDRVRIIVTQVGEEFLATGRPGLPDAALRYFLSP